MIGNLPGVSHLGIQAPLCFVALLVAGAVLYLPVVASAGVGALPAPDCPLARARHLHGLVALQRGSRVPHLSAVPRRLDGHLYAARGLCLGKVCHLQIQDKYWIPRRLPLLFSVLCLYSLSPHP